VISRLNRVAVPDCESSPNYSLWLWIPAFAGMTVECVARVCPQIVIASLRSQ